MDVSRAGDFSGISFSKLNSKDQELWKLLSSKIPAILNKVYVYCIVCKLRTKWYVLQVFISGQVCLENIMTVVGCLCLNY